MRRRLLFYLGALLLLSSAAPIHAQQWVGTLKVGATITDFDGDLASGPTDWTPRVGLIAGGGLGYDFGNGLIPQAEIIYVRRGAETDAMLDGIPIRLRSDLTYLEIPLLLQYRFDTRGYVHPRIFAGPWLAFRLDSQITFSTEQSGLDQTQDDDSIEDRDVGGVAGVAVEIELGSQRLSVETRYSFGTRDITKPDPVVGNPTLKNRGIEILVGFVF